MNVAIATIEYPNHNNNGGLATFSDMLSKLLIKQGHHVIVITLGQPHKKLPSIPNLTIVPTLCLGQIKYLKIPILVFKKTIIFYLLKKYFPYTAQQIYLNIIFLLTFLSVQNKYKIQVIHTPIIFSVTFLIALFFPKIYQIAHAQGPDELLQVYNFPSLDSKTKTTFENYFMIHISKKIIPCSKSVASYITKTYPSVKGKITYIPNFIDTKSYYSKTKKIDTNRLMFFGRLEYRKGPDLALKAFIQLSHLYADLHITFIGDDTKNWIVKGKAIYFHEYIKSLGLPTEIQNRIHLIPRIDERTHLIKLLTQERGIAVLPSRYEPFGYVYIESMASGWITIASHSGAGAQIIRNGMSGYVIQPKGEAIVNCIKTIKNTHNRNGQITENAQKEISKKYDLTSVDKKYSQLYKELYKQCPNLPYNFPDINQFFLLATAFLLNAVYFYEIFSH